MQLGNSHNSCNNFKMLKRTHIPVHFITRSIALLFEITFSEFGTITMKMISSAINNGREQTKIGSINIRVVPPAPQRFFCQRPMVMSVTVGRLKWQADEVPV